MLSPTAFTLLIFGCYFGLWTVLLLLSEPLPGEEPGKESRGRSLLYALIVLIGGSLTSYLAFTL